MSPGNIGKSHIEGFSDFDIDPIEITFQVNENRNVINIVRQKGEIGKRKCVKYLGNFQIADDFRSTEEKQFRITYLLENLLDRFLDAITT